MVDYDQLWFLFLHSLTSLWSTHFLLIGVAEPGFPGYRSSKNFLNSILILKKVFEGGQLQIWPHIRSDTVSQLSDLIFSSCWGTENRWCQIRRIWRVINQFKATVTRVIATTDLCAGALPWWNRTLFACFPGRSWNVSSTTFQSSELSSVGSSGRKQCS